MLTETGNQMDLDAALPQSRHISENKTLKKQLGNIGKLRNKTVENYHELKQNHIQKISHNTKTSILAHVLFSLVQMISQ